MPTPAHQRIVLYLSDELHGFVRPDKRGEARRGSNAQSGFVPANSASRM